MKWHHTCDNATATEKEHNAVRELRNARRRMFAFDNAEATIAQRDSRRWRRRLKLSRRTQSETLDNVAHAIRATGRIIADVD